MPALFVIYLCLVLRHHYDMISDKRSKRQKQESESVLETLRINRTNLTQDELASRCQIPRATYQRWITGKTIARPTLVQLKLLCRELHIEQINELPDDFGVPKLFGIE